MTQQEQDYVAQLRLELRKQWDKAHDHLCNKRCQCESYGLVGHRCKHPMPEILRNEIPISRS